MQWAVYRQVNPYLDKRYIAQSYGCRKNKGTLAAAQALFNWQQLISRKPDAGEWYLIKGDISKYFYRVDHGEILKTYAEVSDDMWFRWLIGVIINNPDVPFGLPVGMRPDDCPRSERLFEVGMPIGNLTSQETANLFLNRLDQYCKHVLKLHYYVRYMDDFCIFVKGKENAEQVFSKIKRFLREKLLLEMSPKSRIQKATQQVEFVGFKITPHGIRLRKKTTNHIKRSLRHVMAAYSAGAISAEKALESVVCYYGMCKHCSAHNLARWIEDNFVLRRDAEAAARQRKAPMKRRFYSIQDNGDGTVDVYLTPEGEPGDLIRVVRGIIPHERLETDIRNRYNDWCESAEIIIL